MNLFALCLLVCDAWLFFRTTTINLNDFFLKNLKYFVVLTHSSSLLFLLETITKFC